MRDLNGSPLPCSAMLWRSGDELLVLHDGTYARIGPDGGVVGWYGERSYSDEDDLWVWAPVLVADQLLMRTTIMHGSAPARVHEEKIVMRGLQPDITSAARQRVEAALAASALASAAATAARSREADARVAAIAGAYDDPGPELARAQAMLVERIRRWNDDEARSLLETLVLLGRALPAAEVAIGFARGCLLACFAHDVPALPVAPAVAYDPVLAARIAAHAAALERSADDQEAVDAHGNAAALAGAARTLREVAAWLGHGR